MKQLFVVVSRNIEEEVKTVVCEDFIEACATQAGMLVGMPADVVKNILKKEEILQIKENIKEWLIDNVRCDDFGESLQRKWRGMHLHGTHVVHEDYPGGIHRESRF